MALWDDLLPEQFTIDLLQQFGTFLCHFLIKEDGSGYSLASIEKYLSGVTNSAQEDSRFNGLELWKDKNRYTRLRSAINKSVVLKCIEEGRLLSEKGAPIGRELLFRICVVISLSTRTGRYVRYFSRGRDLSIITHLNSLCI